MWWYRYFDDENVVPPQPNPDENGSGISSTASQEAIQRRPKGFLPRKFNEAVTPSRAKAGPPGAGGLTKLSVKVIKAGVLQQRIKPGKPQQNGRHERLAFLVIPNHRFAQMKRQFPTARAPPPCARKGGSGRRSLCIRAPLDP
jgi:hypothetical protein